MRKKYIKPEMRENGNENGNGSSDWKTDVRMMYAVYTLPQRKWKGTKSYINRQC